MKVCVPLDATRSSASQYGRDQQKPFLPSRPSTTSTSDAAVDLTLDTRSRVSGVKKYVTCKSLDEEKEMKVGKPNRGVKNENNRRRLTTAWSILLASPTSAAKACN